MENLLRQLERQEGLMSHIQKALGEYLEGQRQVTLTSISYAQSQDSIRYCFTWLGGLMKNLIAAFVFAQ